AAFAGDRDDPDEQERDDDADDRHDDGLPERDAEAEHERRVGDAEDGDVRGEPWPEQVPRDRRPLRLGDDLDPGPLQAETAGLFVCGGRGLWRRCRDARGHGTRVPDNLGRPAHLRIVAGTRLTPDAKVGLPACLTGAGSRRPYQNVPIVRFWYGRSRTAGGGGRTRTFLLSGSGTPLSYGRGWRPYQNVPIVRFWYGALVRPGVEAVP